jgi:hypothetical protein
VKGEIILQRSVVPAVSWMNPNIRQEIRARKIRKNATQSGFRSVFGSCQHFTALMTTGQVGCDAAEGIGYSVPHPPRYCTCTTSLGLRLVITTMLVNDKDDLTVHQHGATIDSRRFIESPPSG